MRACVFKGEGKLVVENVPVPEIKDLKLPKKYGDGNITVRKEDLVKLKILVASICGTDIHILHVPPGHDATKGVILGHEYIGKVIEVGNNVDNVKVGDIVAVDPNIKCGKCWFCRNDMSSMCRNMTTLGIFCDGGFAEYNVAPAKQLFKIPKSMDVEQAIFFEPLSCVTHCWLKLNPVVNSTFLIFGAGPMGCYFTKLAKISGASLVIVSEPSDFRREFARKMGADIVVDPNTENLEEIVKKHTGRDICWGVDVSIDACGYPDVVKQAINLTRPGGKICLFGEQDVNRFANNVSFTKANQKEIVIFGSYVTTRSFDLTIGLLKRKDFNLKPLITHRVKLEDIHTGIEAMKSGKGIKVLVYP